MITKGEGLKEVVFNLIEKYKKVSDKVIDVTSIRFSTVDTHVTMYRKEHPNNCGCAACHGAG